MSRILTRCGPYGDNWYNYETNYLLKQTCGACPEQYDMLDEEGNTLGYFRLRHGRFTVEYPDCGGKLVLHSNPIGDGIFEDEEREYWLTLGYLSIIKEIQNENNS